VTVDPAAIFPSNVSDAASIVTLPEASNVPNAVSMNVAAGSSNDTD